MNYLEAILLAIVEGLTEFLPVSSTGHMIIAGAMLGIEPTVFSKTYTVAIQLGAILAVVAVYWERFFQTLRFYVMLAIGVVPALLFGFIFGDWIDQALERVDVVGYGLLIGGVVLLFVDGWFKADGNPESEINPKNSFIIGTFQCLAILLPGISRSGSTIVGGLTRGLGRKQAAEFSFLLAVPTMVAATGYKLLDFFKDGNRFAENELPLLLTGNLVAFIVAWLAIKGFIQLLEKKGFFLFGVYRIVAGGIILALYYAGLDMAIL